ncbi:MAG: methyl-accepting chemotaxis protein, partial [Rhodocyclaceae bacterium]|nr:methyl-accepting chemotaxis protein [Rhodocyclaceae bacterium]
IGQGADLLQERVARIAQALDEQSRAAEQIAHNIEGIAQMTHSASAISATAGQLSDISRALTGAVSRFRLG